MTPAIKIENLSKQYRLGLVGTGTLSHDMKRWWHLVRGKEDPYLKIGDTNDRATKGNSDYVWALKDINFEVQPGEVLGIIGKNGAGKSTLLKILSKVTAPTTGSITYKGRIGALLEVGTGFNPELTGRENIYLNGAILGMRKREIDRKFDEIVDFSGCERYIDTPTKRYSSGMTVRLGFAVAAFLEPEILVVDEVLAVGDAEFQKKAIGKMQDVSRNDGRTVLFVSHNMTAIKNLCKTGIMLKKGKIEYSGLIDKVASHYLADDSSISILNNQWSYENSPGNENIRIKSLKFIFDTEILTVKSPFDIEIEFWSLLEAANINLSMVVWDINQNPVFNISTNTSFLKKNLNKAIFHIPANLMNDGIYTIQNYFVLDMTTPIFIHDNACTFEIFEDRTESGWHGKWIGAVRPTFIKSNLYSLDPDNNNM